MARLETSSSPSPGQQGRQQQQQASQSGGGASAGSAAGGGHKASASSPEVGPIEPEDMREALLVTKASARQYEKKYAQFSEEYGQLGS